MNPAPPGPLLVVGVTIGLSLSKGQLCPLLSCSLPRSASALPQIYADPTKRLELYFRPKDPYCHPVCANRFSTSSLLLRVRRKTRRQREVLGPEPHPGAMFDIEILGIISTVYKFQGNCSFLRGVILGPVSTSCRCSVGPHTGKGASLCPGMRGGG